jgi:hypothetical protein
MATDAGHHKPLTFSNLWRILSDHNTHGMQTATNLNAEIGQVRRRVGSIKRGKKVLRKYVLSGQSPTGSPLRREHIH